MNNCVFCSIAEGSIPSKKVYEDEQILAFYDLEPQAKVHVLVIPKQHIACVDEVNADNSGDIAHIFETIPVIAKELGLKDGYRVVTNCGQHGCQSVKHLHFHVLGGEQLNGRMVCHAKDSMDSYTVNIAGVERDLIKYPVSDKLDIAAFIMFGDVEVTEKAAEALLKICPEHDVVVSAEAKGIPLCYEMARQGCREYVIARKSIKVYMRNCVGVSVNSITTAEVQKLYLGDTDIAFLQGKRILIVDDVISTGESLAALEALMNKINANVVGKACVLAEGDAKNRKDIIFLEELPVFKK